MSTFDSIISECKEIASSTGSMENVVRFLRENGFSKVQSIKFLVDNFDVTLGSAKELVHNSESWSDVRERDNEFQSLIFNLLDEDDNSER